MKVICEQCNTGYRVDEARIRKTGSTARCRKCGHVFKVYPPEHPDINDRETAAAFLRNCLLLDLETGPDGTIWQIGAVFNDETFVRKGQFNISEALRELDQFAQEATHVLGHNLLSHDLPVLSSRVASLAILRLPVIDTLYLSPLAFPENPYHRLVKDYKLVRASVSNPVADARLAGSVFIDQWESLAALGRKQPDVLAFYRYACNGMRPRGTTGDSSGISDFFGRLGARNINDRDEALQRFCRLTEGCVCPVGVRNSLPSLLESPETRPAAAYILAWLRVAGGNSVLPPWVRYHFPEVVPPLAAMRDVPCGDPDCSWCAEIHNPVRQIQRYFGYESFRPLPDGRSLQEDLVTRGMGNQPLLGILPTGFGKSICFQLPALVRYYRRGLLTVVISPLQSLMKDQVENLKTATGTHSVGAIYGQLTPLERGEVLEGIRMGDIGILYISPEQLRNHSVRQALQHREIGCWVFDEAHCLSKWGHDFRPDYLYAARFIREFAESRGVRIPPVACFTATAKADVTEEILTHFADQLGQTLEIFAGGHERNNLRFEVRTVSDAEKFEQISELLTERLGRPPAGSAVIYCATRKKTMNMAKALSEFDWTAEAFHGKLTAPEKRRVQDAFIAGDVPVICATNAFGMGIDKSDVRLVVHADIPGSLENYLQEAGRAGRDGVEADCILLYHTGDIDTQFGLSSLSRLHQRDIAGILRGLRRLKGSRDNEVVITTGELLRDQSVKTSIDSEDSGADTRVKSAISWLERAGYLERNENRTRVFQGRPRFKSLTEAGEALDRLNLSASNRHIWETILEAMINCDPDEGLSADDLVQILGHVEPNGEEGINTRRVMDILHQMVDAGLIRSGLLLSAYLRPKGRGNARKVFGRVCDIDRAMLAVMRESHPDESVGEWVDLHLRELNQRLRDREILDVNPEVLRTLLQSLAWDGRGLAGGKGSISLRHLYQDRWKVQIRRPWTTIAEIAERRRKLAGIILEALYARIPESLQGQAQILVDFASDDLVDAIRRDLTIQVDPERMLPAIDRGLLFLHEQRAIILQKGLSVFRQALTIRILPEAKARRYSKGDYEPLAHHYRQRNFQIHVMDEYARLGLQKISQALELILAYFTLDTRQFIRRFFADRQELLEIATSETSYKTIVSALKNPVQEAIVCSPPEKNALILAGPGAGKTRVVVHRCAYLLRVKRVPPESVLVLCFNHSAALSVRRRLRDLVDRDAAGVTVLTYHSLAMRLTGTAFTGGDFDREGRFEDIIREATALLRGETDIPGMAPDEIRERLLAGYRYILVDEYQDIDGDQYALISALAGRTLGDPDGRLSILAVGDDDQSIYGFRRANVRYIRQFQEDYAAEVHHLVENYRSTAHIIGAANSLIALNTDRMKTGHTIRVDRLRKHEPSGGSRADRDPLCRGMVARIHVNNAATQAAALVDEIRRLNTLDPHIDLSQVAILARNGMDYPALSAVRSALKAAEISFSYPLGRSATFPFHRIREVAVFLENLSQNADEMRSASELVELVPGGAVHWCGELHRLIDVWAAETGDARLFVRTALDFFYEALIEQRRDQRMGHGVHLSTVHGAKGQEFDHIFVLDGDWRSPDNPTDMEEERRLYYVAMTRARETLTVFQRSDCCNPHVVRLDPNHLMDRSVEPIPLADGNGHRWRVLGMRDVYLDFAARRNPDEPIHTALKQLQAGDRLRLANGRGNLQLIGREGIPVAQLSRNARSFWQNRLTAVDQVTVLAIVRRRVEDVCHDYRKQIRCERWEIPIVEVAYRD